VSSTSSVISVTELNRRARLAIEKSLPSCWIDGEISNWVQASSGHWYFTLKDQQSSVKCAFFRNRNQFMDWKPSEGNRVEVRAQATLYEPRGDYQLIVDVMRRAGQGELYEEFLRLKAKLDAEGLFQSTLKLPLPKLPRIVGIVTSLQAAALQDALKTLQNRWPASKVIIYPSSVQGGDAADSLTQALSTAIQRQECDVLLLIRGGGNLEDLHAFNNEKLARSIRSTNIPIITGIGHETDFSIADFASDLRAATPTAAAQSAVPDKVEMQAKCTKLQSGMINSLQRLMYQSMQTLDGLTRRVLHPANRITHAKTNVQQLKSRLSLNSTYRINQLKHKLEYSKIRHSAQRPDCESIRLRTMTRISALETALLLGLDQRKSRLNNAIKSLQQLHPERILSRGYCIVQTVDGVVLRDAGSVTPDSKLKITLRTGYLDATVNKVTP
jgi:exodeoxyribonuclease VII large subunit